MLEPRADRSARSRVESVDDSFELDVDSLLLGRVQCPVAPTPGNRCDDDRHREEDEQGGHSEQDHGERDCPIDVDLRQSDRERSRIHRS